MLDFLRELASVAAPEVLLFSKVVFTFVGKLDFFWFIFSHQFFSYTVVLSGPYHIFMLSIYPHSIFEHR